MTNEDTMTEAQATTTLPFPVTATPTGAYPVGVWWGMTYSYRCRECPSWLAVHGYLAFEHVRDFHNGHRTTLGAIQQELEGVQATAVAALFNTEVHKK